MITLLINIKELIQVREKSVKKVIGKEMQKLPTLKNAFLAIDNGEIINYGVMDDIPSYSAAMLIDCKDKFVFPTWCDSHTHIVYAGHRAQEYVNRINGSYDENTNRSDIILNCANELQDCCENMLYEQSKDRLDEVIGLGTGAIEIKSGYGLNAQAELKILRVIKKLRENYCIPIKATFLGANVLPNEYKNNREAYVDEIINEMLPRVVEENLAEFVDVVCEEGHFSVDETEKIMTAAKINGLQTKVHVNQYGSIGGIQASVKHNAISVDHLETLTKEDIHALQGSNTMPVALPSFSYFLNHSYTPAREIIDNNLPLALATNYNADSTPSGNMNFVISNACLKMKMTPEEAINAATLNGAYAMNLADEVGFITKGKKANFFITKKIPSYDYIPYSFGPSLIDSVYINGRKHEQLT